MTTIQHNYTKEYTPSF